MIKCIGCYNIFSQDEIFLLGGKEYCNACHASAVKRNQRIEAAQKAATAEAEAEAANKEAVKAFHAADMHCGVAFISEKKYSATLKTCTVCGTAVKCEREWIAPVEYESADGKGLRETQAYTRYVYTQTAGPKL